MDSSPVTAMSATSRMPLNATSCALDDALRVAIAREGASTIVPTQAAVVVVDVRQWSCWQRQASHYLSERDRRQLARLRRADEQQWRCMGYALLRLWLSRTIGLPSAQVEVARDADGRPLLASGLGDISLSHAGPWFAFAFAWATQGRVGVDLESRERAAGMEGLEDYVCHPHERDSLVVHGQADHMGLLRLWTRKEAALKRAGLGLSLEPKTFVAPSDTPFRLPGLGDWVQVSELALEAPVCLALAHAPGMAPAAHWLRP
ncbi:4'-phosphopantetheinyl transferase superfamily protein [Pseudoxanthomonas composti]|uniref:4'-phosphopantetheinyl transferase superfamily protein n=2 Tax=Pseudoxanthomonas composti TaxID=2137479 RepID=A0A4Q1JZU4_9GAMM|nr:4'-phosphopantetheinyl transferase superfamily protein [Pseudoxanthomonas composti]